MLGIQVFTIITMLQYSLLNYSFTTHNKMKNTINTLLGELVAKDEEENDKVAELKKARAAAKGIKLKPKPPEKLVEPYSLADALKYARAEK